jgi:hypothetical protein
VLIPNEPFRNQGKTPVFIIDWELSQLGVRACDIAEVLADLYSLWLYQKIEAGLWIMQGFVETYGDANADSVYRTVIQVGARMMCQSLELPDWGDDESVKKEVVKLSGELIERAWQKDRTWFESGELAFLFSGVKA